MPALRVWPPRAQRRARAENAKNLPPNVPGWTRQLGDGVGVRAYGNPSKYEKEVDPPHGALADGDAEILGELHAACISSTASSRRTGSASSATMAASRRSIPDDYRLMVHGLVDKPLIFTLDDLKRLPRINRVYFLECAANSGMEWRGAQLNGCQYTHGMVHCVQYTGVSLKLLLEQAGLKPNAKWIMAEGGDAAAMNRSIPVSKALDDCMIAYRMNGEMLRPEQGYPARLVVPGWEGNVWIKWLRRLKVGDQPWFTREETSKYTDLLENGKARQVHLRDGCQIRDHLAVAAGAGEAKGIQRHFWTGMVGPRQGQACRRLARRRAQLAHRAHRRPDPR